MSTETNKYIDSLLNAPKAYKNNAYGDLNKLYDFAKNNDLSKMTDEEKKSFYFDLETLKNRLIKFVETKYLKPDRKDLLIHRIKYLYEKVYSSDFLNSDLIIEINNKILKLKDVFDFELEPEIENKQVIDPNAQKLILDAIIEVKEQIERTSEKSGKNDKPKFKDFFNPDYKKF